MSEYKVNSGQNIFDVVISTTGNFNGVYSLIQENGISDITSSIVGEIITYIPGKPTPPTIKSQGSVSASVLQEFLSIPNQSVYDVVLQVYGDLNLTYQLIRDSNFSNILTRPLPQTIFKFNPTKTADAIFASYLSKNGIVINTVDDNKLLISDNPLQDAGGIDLQDAGGIQLEPA